MSLNLLDRMIEPFAACLTKDAAQKIVDLRADSTVQNRVDELATKANQGLLTLEECAEYDRFLAAFHFVTIVQAKARQVLRS